MRCFQKCISNFDCQCFCFELDMLKMIFLIECWRALMPPATALLGPITRGSGLFYAIEEAALGA